MTVNDSVSADSGKWTETRSKAGAIVPLHYHAAFAAAKPISSELVAKTWKAGVGRTKSVGGDLAVVEPFDPAGGGIGYIVKQITDHGCEWDLRNTHLFGGGIHAERKSDHASLRSARRWQAQMRSSEEEPAAFDSSFELAWSGHSLLLRCDRLCHQARLRGPGHGTLGATALGFSQPDSNVFYGYNSITGLFPSSCSEARSIACVTDHS